MAKQNFLGLVKFSGTYDKYQEAQAAGKLIFANVRGENAGKYIWANGLEYKVADDSNLDELIERVNNLDLSVADISSWKREVEEWIPKVDTSIVTLETSTNTLETWRTHIDNVSVDSINASVADLSTKMVNANASIADLSTRMDAVEDFGDKIDSLESSVGLLETSVGALETSIGGLIRTATMTAAAKNGVATVQLEKTTDAGTTTTDSYTITGDDYVAVGQSAANAITLTTKIGDIATATIDASGLATAYDVSAFVMNQLGELSNALVFRGGVDGNEHPLPTTKQKTGDTYVATAAFEDQAAQVKADSGDLIIWNGNSWVVVERNLDGAVTSGDTLTAGYMVQGAGNQAVETSTVSLASLVDVSNNAVRTVNANTSTADYLDVQAVKHDQTVDISYGVKIQDVSTAAAVGNGLADAKHVKDYVDAKAADVKVEATLDSSTPNYVDATASVDETGRIISASVGVKVATLADASDGGADFKALADARNVYEELTKVEEVVATANAAMVKNIGLNSDYSVTWSTASGISADASIVKAIEEVAVQAAQSGVTSFGEKKGAISIDETVATDGSVAFAMDGSTLKGTVVGWSGLVTRVGNNESSIGEVSTRLNDLSTYVHTTVNASIDNLQAKDVEIDASIDRLDTSVSALEDALDDYKVKSIEGETGISARANDEFVAVSASEPDANGKVSLDASVQLAEDVTLPSGATHETATGLATDGWVKDFLAWDVIGDE